MVDYRLPDEDGLALARALKALPRAPRVLIYSAYADQVLALAAIVAGADSTLSKSTVAADVVRVIVATAEGRTQHPDPPPSVTRAVAQHIDERDVPILAMLVHHVPPAEIADALQIPRGWLEARRWAMLQRIVRAPNGAYRRRLTANRGGRYEQDRTENPRPGASSRSRWARESRRRFGTGTTTEPAAS